ncbi:unnamed protein product, partial [Tetraodon nigroviridis]
VLTATSVSGGRGSCLPAAGQELQSGPGGLRASTNQRRTEGTLVSSGQRAADCEAGERRLTGDSHPGGR